MLSHTQLGVWSLALTSTILASPFDLASRQTTSNCSTGIHMIVLGGLNPENSEGLLSGLVANVTSEYPGSDVYLPPYDGSGMPAPAATQETIQAVENYTASCPDTPIVMMGYSIGGIIMMNTLCGGLPEDIDPKIIAAIAYGEETRTADEPYNRGNCTGPAPVFPRADPSTCDRFASEIQSYCMAEDPQCCTNGTDQSVHYLYGETYDPWSFGFIEDQYAMMSNE